LRILRYTLSYFFIFILLLFTQGCANQPSEANTTQKKSIGLLWKISKKNTPTSYLFGTMHSEDERVISLPPAVTKAFKASTTFALEMALDETTTKSVLANMYFSDGKRLDQLLTSDVYKQTIKAMQEKGLPEDIVAHMKPWAIFTILNMPDQKTGLFLDALLYKSAQKLNKKIVGLETPKEQTDVFDGMPMDVQVSLLKSTLKNALDMDAILEKTLQVYLSKDLDAILVLNDKYLELVEKDVGDLFTKRLVTDRNHRMVERIIPQITQDKLFIAVGALHLPGEQGIINLLRNHGYEVQAIY